MKIELQESLELALKQGINLFLGAGFSVYAKNYNGLLLPVSSNLCTELTREFNCPSVSDLSKICTIIDSFNSEGLRNYLITRFNVNSFPDFYNNIQLVNCPRIFTTNIDNLVSKIYSTKSKKFLNNIFTNGLCFRDSNCIDYIPLHGSIEVEDSKFLFNMQEVASSFRSQRNGWASLSLAANQIPSLFIGYSLNDSAVIESLFSDTQLNANQKNKWIILKNEEPGNIAYFKALGFSIIISDVKDFLLYLEEIGLEKQETTRSSKDYLSTIFPESRIPKNASNIRIRSIDEFFLGDSPIWSDILSNRIYKTSHFLEIVNLIERPKNLIITGIPASGKSTLMLQVAKHIESYKRVFVFNSLSINKSNIIKNEIKAPTVLLIDNFTNDIDAFTNLSENRNIKLIGFDRYYNVDLSIHKLPNDDFEFYDVSDLTPQDIQGVYNLIPLTMRRAPMVYKDLPSDIPSLFEIVNYNINKTTISKRYLPVIKDLNSKDPLLLELLIMACYLHACRTPVSFEVANAFLSDDVDSYEEVIGYLQSLTGMINEVVGSIVDEYNDQDYFQPRSQILSETILAQTNNTIFKQVYEKFHLNVPQHVIPQYYVFKRYAYDASYAIKAFSNWKDGLSFYEDVYRIDRSPFILQQASLYLLRKKRFGEAAIKIDHALQTCKKRYFSIDNTHAIIMFKANINSTNNDSQVRLTLDKSMEILKSCYYEDQRKTYHAITFAEQSLEYFARFSDNTAQDYLKLSEKWLKEVQIERKYNIRARSLQREIENLL
jgi:hypothetical protein